MPSKGLPSLSFRAEPSLRVRVERAAERAGVTKAEWLRAAIEVVLEDDERGSAGHTPTQVLEATPRRMGTRVYVPSGRIFERRR